MKSIMLRNCKVRSLTLLNTVGHLTIRLWIWWRDRWRNRCRRRQCRITLQVPGSPRWNKCQAKTVGRVWLIQRCSSCRTPVSSLCPRANSMQDWRPKFRPFSRSRTDKSIWIRESELVGPGGLYGNLTPQYQYQKSVLDIQNLKIFQKHLKLQKQITSHTSSKVIESHDPMAPTHHT